MFSLNIMRMTKQFKVVMKKDIFAIVIVQLFKVSEIVFLFMFVISFALVTALIIL